MTISVFPLKKLFPVKKKYQSQLMISDLDSSCVPLVMIQLESDIHTNTSPSTHSIGLKLYITHK